MPTPDQSLKDMLAEVAASEEIAAKATAPPWIVQHETIKCKPEYDFPDRQIAVLTTEREHPQLDSQVLIFGTSHSPFFERTVWVSPEPADADFCAYVRAAHPRFCQHIRQLVERVQELENPLPGNIEDQAAAWTAVFKALEDAGMLSFLASDMRGRVRAVEFVKHLTARIASLESACRDLAGQRLDDISQKNAANRRVASLESLVVDGYVQHKAGCRSIAGWPEDDPNVRQPCDCGLTARLADLCDPARQPRRLPGIDGGEGYA